MKPNKKSENSHGNIDMSDRVLTLIEGILLRSEVLNSLKVFVLLEGNKRFQEEYEWNRIKVFVNIGWSKNAEACSRVFASGA